ncbi:MAG: efflux RND transporter periplasmic adaptor subunit, partial [Marinobacter sp.]
MAANRHATGKWIFWLALAVLASVALVFVLRPEPVWVDLATVEQGPMEVTIMEEGKTRVKD